MFAKSYAFLFTENIALLFAKSYAFLFTENTALLLPKIMYSCLPKVVYFYLLLTKIISGVLYEIRKAFNDSRLKRNSGHLSDSESVYYGCCLSWVQGIFFIQAIRCKQSLLPTNKLVLAHLLEFEYWMEKAMYEFDFKTALELAGFITSRIDTSNDCLYIYMRKINLEYFLLNGGKKAFKALPGLLEKACYGTLGYNLYREELEREAKRLKIKVTSLELDDDYFDYESVKW